MPRSVESIWSDLCGFTAPKCPECSHPASLDEDGYWCERCSDPTKSNPAVDDIPNGDEFDAILAEHRQAVLDRNTSLRMKR